MVITFALKIWFDALEQGLLFSDVITRLDELREYLQEPGLYWDNLSVVIGDLADLQDDGRWLPRPLYEEGGVLELRTYYGVHWLHHMVEDFQRFIRGGIFCFLGEGYACWLFHATSHHVAMYTVPYDFYQQHHPTATGGSTQPLYSSIDHFHNQHYPETKAPCDFFEIARDWEALRRDTTLQPYFVVELSDWIRGTLTVGRQYNALLLAVKDFIWPMSANETNCSEPLYTFCDAFPYYEQQMVAWLKRQEN